MLNGAEVNAKAFQYGDDAERDRGITPLHAAAGNGHVGIAKLLIENGANDNAKNDSGESALMRSTQDGNHQIAQLLIDNGANPLDVYFSEKDVSLFQAANKGDVESLSQHHPIPPPPPPPLPLPFLFLSTHESPGQPLSNSFSRLLPFSPTL